MKKILEEKTGVQFLHKHIDSFLNVEDEKINVLQEAEEIEKYKERIVDWNDPEDMFHLYTMVKYATIAMRNVFPEYMQKEPVFTQEERKESAV